ncbi:MAG: DUF4125 family protein [Anaeroplasmataceae bacterium]
MDEKAFLEELDKLFSKHNLENISTYLEDSLNNAILKKNTSLIITILNEMIGFYRDISDYETSYKYALSLHNLILKANVSYEALFITFINIANAYRAYKELDKSIDLFLIDEKIYFDNKLNRPKELAALYNNLSLAYEEKKEYETSLLYLNKALELIKETKDEIKIASTLVNMAMCYLSINKLDNAKEVLDKASIVFENNQNDFHYSGYAAAMAKYYNLTNNIKQSIKYYESALAHLLMTVGKNEYYNQIKDELFKLYEKNNINPHIKGLDLSEAYFKYTRDKLFEGLDENTINSLTIGLFGLGSECYGADDIISEDHDFDPGYIVLVLDSVSKETFNIIVNNYNSLEKCFNRFYVMPLDKKGVHYFSQYLREFLGVKDINNLSEQSKSLITNGRIFHNGFFTKYNNLIYNIKKDTNYNYLPNIILKTLEINQYIPYNLNRALERKDYRLYELLKNHLIDKLIEYYYLYHKKYLPHDKLALKLIDDNSIIKKWIYQIMDNNLDGLFETISSHLLKVLDSYGCIKKLGTIYIEDYRFELVQYIKEYNYKRDIIEKIVDIEWNMFIKLENIGGKASCQSNPRYFKLMRETQFIVWDSELLNSYLNDLNEALNYGYNTLAIKYAFMEETLDPIHFEIIKNNLPLLSDKRKALQEEVIKVQLAQLEDFSKNNPLDAAQMRSVNTSSDNIYNASYETYLRGELSSYSEKTLYLYAMMISNLENNNKNLVDLTIKFTKLYKTTEEGV